MRYLEMAVWPHDLTGMYPFPTRMMPAWQIVGAVVVLVAVSILAMLRIKKQPFLFSGWFLFTGALVPALGLMQTGRWPALADRFAYIPFIGLYVIATWGMVRLWRAFRLSQATLSLISVLTIVVLTTTAWFQTQYWRNSLVLFTKMYELNGDQFVYHDSLAQSYLDNGMIKESIPHLEVVVRNDPNLVEFQYNLGLALIAVGRKLDAVRHLEKAIQLDTFHTNARINLAGIFIENGNFFRAEELLLGVVQHEPDSIEGNFNLGLVYQNQNSVDKALACYARVVEIDPSNVTGITYLAMAHLAKGDTSMAAKLMAKAVSLAPDNPEVKRSLAVLNSAQKHGAPKEQ